MLSEPVVLNREVEGAVLVYENRLGKPGKRLRSSVDLAYNYVCLEGDDSLYCVNSAGRVLWKYQIPSGIFDFKVSIEGKYVAVASNTGGMFYIDNTGKLLWSYSLGRAIPMHAVSPDGSVVVGTTIHPSGRGHTLCIISRTGQVLRHISIPAEVVALGTSFDGSVILTGDINNNVAQYSKTGDRQWIYCIRAPIQDIVVSQSGLLIFALTSEIISISPSGTERWRIKLPEGPVSSIRMSHDGSVNIACGSGVIFRFDLKGKVLWKHPMPTRKPTFLLSYRSHNIVLLRTTGIEYWDKYGFSISSFVLPGIEHTSEDCIAVSQDGRFLIYLDDLGVLRQLDVGKVLARHLINASKIFLEELRRLGTVSQGAEENLQWAIESLNDGDVQYALSFGYQAYTSMETTLDSLPARKTSAPQVTPQAPAPASASPPAGAVPAKPPQQDYTGLYRKALMEIFSLRDEPTETEWKLLTIMREAFGIDAETHNELEEEVREEALALRPKPAPTAPATATAPAAHATSARPEVPITPTPAPPVSLSLEAPAAPSRSTPAAPAAPPTTTIEDFEEVVEEEAEAPSEFKEPRPVAPATQPTPVSGPEPVRQAPPVEVMKKEPDTAAPSEKREEKAAEASFSMDNYVSEILSKYLKK